MSISSRRAEVSAGGTMMSSGVRGSSWRGSASTTCRTSTVPVWVSSGALKPRAIWTWSRAKKRMTWRRTETIMAAAAHQPR